MKKFGMINENNQINFDYKVEPQKVIKKGMWLVMKKPPEGGFSLY
jgi:hypothetical protein